MHLKRKVLTGVAADNQISLSTGGNFTGELSTSRTIFTGTEAVRKAYFTQSLYAIGYIEPTDYLLRDGSVVMDGPLLAPGTATISNHGVNKAQADTAIDAGLISLIETAIQTEANSYTLSTLAPTDAVIKSGTILKSATVGTFTNWLRCNGAVVSQATYSTLYSIIGSIHNVPISQKTGGKPWQNQYVFNTTATASDLSSWITDSLHFLAVIVILAQVIVTKNRAYILGGHDGSTYVNTAYSASIDVNGVLDSFTLEAGANLPAPLAHSSVVITKNKAYLIGGYNGTVNTNVIYSTAINSDGTLGTWQICGYTPITVISSSSVIIGNKLYIIGGYISSVATNKIYVTTIDQDNGNLGIWTECTSLPVNVANAGVAVIADTLYLIGGENGVYFNYVYKATINVDNTLGPWVASTGGYLLPQTATRIKPIVTHNRIYLLGTYRSGVSSIPLWSASIDGSGALSTWSTGTNFPATLQGSDVIVTSSRVYLIGGIINGVPASNVHYTTFVGGLNNYMSTFEVTAVNTTTHFTLPNMSTQDAITPGFYSHIRI